MKLFFKLFPVICIAGLITYGVLILFTSFNKSQIIGDSAKELFEICLQKIGLEDVTLLSTVARAQKEVSVPSAELWESFKLVQLWPEWSPMHKEIKVPERFIFQPKSTFSQILDLGFPIGEITSREQLDLVDEEKRIALWWNKQDGLSSCHFWLFEDVGQGRTRISNIEVFDGAWSAIIKPIGQQTWSSKFQDTIEGLVEYAENDK